MSSTTSTLSTVEQNKQAIENYWAGFMQACKGSERELPVKLFLQARDLFFDLEAFHPEDKTSMQITEDYKRGQFDAMGTIQFQDGIPFVTTATDEVLEGVAALEFLHSIYEKVNIYDPDNNRFDPDNVYLYKRIACNNPKYLDLEEKTITYRTTQEQVPLPYKKRSSDAGYIVHAIKKIATNQRHVTYDTCLVLEPPFGFCFEVFPTPDLYKTKHAFANGSSYFYERSDATRGISLKIPLVKTATNASLPDMAPVALIVPRLVAHFPLVENNI